MVKVKSLLLWLCIKVYIYHEIGFYFIWFNLIQFDLIWFDLIWFDWLICKQEFTAILLLLLICSDFFFLKIHVSSKYNTGVRFPQKLETNKNLNSYPCWFSGTNCHECIPLYYRPIDKQQSDEDACQPCGCYLPGTREDSTIGLLRGECVMNNDAANPAGMVSSILNRVGV